MSAMPPFLTNEEIFALVEPLVQPAAIVRWFNANGFPELKLRPNGLPVIARSQFEAVFGPLEQKISGVATVEQPDVSALLTKIAKGQKSKATSR